MKIKYNIQFTPESRRSNGVPIVENVPIRMRVSFNRQRIDFSTGYRIDVKKWNGKKQRVKDGCTNKLKQSSSDINSDLNRYEADIHDIFKEYEVKGETPTPQQIKDAFNERNGSKEKTETKPDVFFFNVFDEFLSESAKENSWNVRTIQKLSSSINHIRDFKPDAAFEYWDEPGLNSYLDYLRDVKKMRNSSIKKQLSLLKWFFRWALKKGYHNNIAFDTFKPKLKTVQKKVIFLSKEELDQLRVFAIPESKNYLERVRDVFLFQCFTGLRHSDVANLKRADVKDSHIEITTVKTAESLFVDLNDHSKAILNKYKDFHFKDDKALPVISNQKMNDYLKELGELAGIKEPVRETYFKGNERIDIVTPKYSLLSTHAGRRTFICNALALGISIQVVMEWTGHSDYKEMKPYIDVANNIKATAMNKFNEL
ncbi:MAG: phage integrase SAM-like domain-containing protein [Mangrovibacterium sp.]|nr:phage integrase SAM-like domain-containing protein [Mangrovibacterium sp.]